MQQPARRMDHVPPLPDRLDHPGLVVGRHDGDQRRRLPCHLQLVEPPLQGAKDRRCHPQLRRILQPGPQESGRRSAPTDARSPTPARRSKRLPGLSWAGFERRRQRQHVGFGSAGGEHDVARFRPDQRRHLFARLLDGARAARPSRWTEDGLPPSSSAAIIGGARFRPQRRGGIPVEVGSLGHDVRPQTPRMYPFRLPARSSCFLSS